MINGFIKYVGKHAEYVAHIVRMKRLRTFQKSPPPQEEVGEVKQIVAWLQYYTRAEVCSEAMEGGHLFVGRANFQECCEEMACSLINLNRT